MGKAKSEKPNVVAARKLVIGLKMPIINGQADSVRGLCHALMSVGTAARASPKMAKTIATLGLLVRNHRIRAKPESNPHR